MDKMKVVATIWVAAACMAQGRTAVAQARSAPAATQAGMAFDVVSVRENKTPPGPRQMPEIGPTPDGYRSMNVPLILPLLAAYVPSPGGASVFSYRQVVGLPDWANQGSYDISAKVAAEDVAAWQKPGLQPAMLQGMLQAMFAERFKLAVHREIKDQPVYLLVVAKSGAKLKQTDPEKTPPGMQTPFGGVMVQDQSGMHLYGVSTGAVAALLSAVMGGERAMVDETGLTGKYDVHLRGRESMAPGEEWSQSSARSLMSLG